VIKRGAVIGHNDETGHPILLALDVSVQSEQMCFQKSVNNNNNSRISIPPSVVTSEAVLNKVKR